MVLFDAYLGAKKIIFEMKSEYLRKNFFNRVVLSIMMVMIFGEVEMFGYEVFLSSGVRTVVFGHAGVTNREEGSVPQLVFTRLGAAEDLTLDFDILGGNSEALYYSFVHCNADFSPSELMEIEYVEGFNKFYSADTYAQSFNTTMDYVHYHLDISTAPIKVSGAYIIEVRTVNDERLLLTQPFWVSENRCDVLSFVERDGGRQSLSVAVEWANHSIMAPEAELKVCVWQNKRLDDLRFSSLATFIRRDDIVYQDVEEFSFDSGSEWRWLDNRSTRRSLMTSASVEYHAPLYYFVLAPDEISARYSYHEDFNGGEYIYNTERSSEDASVVADYVVNIFTLHPDDPSLLDTHDVYVIGDATSWTPSSSNKLSPVHESLSFQGQILTKQGLHNYLYVCKPKKGKGKNSPPTFSPIENSFSDTENDYFIAVYLRRPSDTYDHLVAYRIHNTLTTLNDFIK